MVYALFGDRDVEYKKSKFELQLVPGAGISGNNMGTFRAKITSRTRHDGFPSQKYENGEIRSKTRVNRFI